MRLPDALAPSAATEPARPNAAAPADTTFTDIFQQVRTEVDDFLAHGDGTSLHDDTGMAAGHLSAEGQWHLARSQPAAPGGATSTIEQQFLASIAPLARDAGLRLGVAPELVAAHAALESGWGQRPVRTRSGSDSHNLFGIKAGGAWTGAVANAATTEYQDGKPQATSANFRSYPDPASAFDDYARLLLNNPRFSGALHAGADAHAFAQGLARGGYATDPAYAAKLGALAARLQGAGTGPPSD